MQAHRYSIDRVQGHTFLRNFLSPNGRVMDLGMNKGAFAKTMRTKYGCSIVGAEANPALASALCGIDGILCKEAAVCASDGSVRFSIDENDTEASQIASDGAPSSNTVVVVPSVSLASFFQEFNVTQLDLLKMDIEGSELDVIESTNPSVFRKCTQITIEFHSFLRPADRGRVENAIGILASNRFYPVDFSTERTDVLFINNDIIRVSRFGKAFLVTQKYQAGIARRLRRMIARH